MNPGKIHHNEPRLQSTPPLDRYGQFCIPTTSGMTIEYQERGLHAVDVQKVFPGTYRELTANCWLALFFFYAITKLTLIYRRAIGLNKYYDNGLSKLRFSGIQYTR